MRSMIACLVLCALVLAACGGAGSPTATATPFPTVPPSPTFLQANPAGATQTAAASLPTPTSPLLSLPTTAAAVTPPITPTQAPQSAPLTPTAQRSAAPGAASVQPNAAAVVERLKASGLPIGEVVVWTAENDPNKLLGRPFQYTSKATFRDTRLAASAEPSIEAGGDVEVFATLADLQSRKTYIESVTKTSPLLVQYIFSSNLALLRLGKALTPDQAKQYEAALATTAGAIVPASTGEALPLDNLERIATRSRYASLGRNGAPTRQEVC